MTRLTIIATLTLVVNLSMAGDVHEDDDNAITVSDTCTNAPTNCSCSIDDNPPRVTLIIKCQKEFNNSALEELFVSMKGNITHVQFRNSYLKEVPRQLCILKRLTSLDLSGNNIQHLSRKSIGCLNHISVLDLSNNEVRRLENFTFSGLEQLRELYLGFNKIDFIDTAVFNKDLKSLSLIDMQRNKLREIDFWVFRLPNALQSGHKVFLNLTFNKLETFTNHINWSINEAKLGHEVLINFQYNNFGRLGELIKVFKLIHVDIDNPIVMFLQLRRLWDMGFDFRYNKLYCDCDMFKITKLIKNFIPMFNRTVVEYYINIPCYYPKNLRGMIFYTVPDNMFQCSVKKDCPESCSCVHTPANRTTRVECHDIKRLPDRIPCEDNIELRLANNAIETLKPKSYTRNVSVLDVANNKISSIKPSLVNKIVKSKKTSLLLELNRIEYLPETAWKQINPTNVREIRLGQNPLQCDCKSLWLKHWLIKNRDVVSDIMTVQCDNEPVRGKRIIDIADSDFFCVNWALVTLQLSIMCGLVLIGFIGVAFALADDRRMTPIQSYFDINLNFDIFLSFCDKDKQWVKRYLIDTLMYEDGLTGQDLDYGACGPAPGHEPGKWYYIAFADKDFVHGQQITQNIANFIATSRVTLMVISKNFLQSNWCKYEFRTAHNNALSRKGVKLIAIKYGDLRGVPIDTDLEMHLQSHTYLDTNEPDFYGKLKRALPEPLYKRLQEDVEDIAESIDGCPLLRGDENRRVYDYGAKDVPEAHKDNCYSPLLCDYNPRNAMQRLSINHGDSV
ncbi:unnamed protein product [Owenia fusiformis]|uniref:TIR domain-containing protein n=1 Tax=Owenia fusiformis TaxID=6347 RepID=A0A8S4N097_OWEFU|nr:unnamed protein product [Owenia fusiformis]